MNFPETETMMAFFGLLEAVIVLLTAWIGLLAARLQSASSSFAGIALKKSFT